LSKQEGKKISFFYLIIMYTIKTEKIQRQAKDIFKDIDLYGIDLLIEVLKQYPFISWRDKTIPNEGSPARLVIEAKF
jgi:hypothetical protein